MKKSEQEDTDLYFEFQAFGIKGGALDANDVAKEGEWVDSAGQPLTYTNWYKNQPSNSHGKDHYAEYNVEMKGQWNDGPATHIDYVVYERPIDSKLFYDKS